VGALALSCLPGVAQAESEMDILLNKLVEKGVLTGVEAGLIRKEVAETKETRNKQLAKEIVPDSARNWQWKGDIRLRDEYRNREGTGQDFHRQRIRFRYGVTGKVSDQLKVTARIATGSTSDPVSTNQSFNTFFNKKNVVLDLANLEYTPEVPGLSKVALVGGIMESPLWTVGPMVWDGDLSWDGAAVKVSKEMGPVSLFANNGVFLLDTDESEASSLWVTQGGVSITPFPDAQEELLKNLKLTGALAYHDYVNVSNCRKAGTNDDGSTSGTLAGSCTSGSTTTLNRETQNSPPADYNQLNPAFEIASTVNQMPVAVFTDWIHNTSANSKVNDGFQVGLKVGKAKNPFVSFSNGLNLKDGWEAGYFFQQMQRDAAFDEFADSDFNDGGTNNKGHAFWVTLATLKNSTFGMKYLIGKQLEGAKDVENRVQMDWVTKF
jgi:hypothetical protein